MDSPIIFSGPMVRALLDGRKTQTRRLAWGKPLSGLYESDGGPLTPIPRKSSWQRVKPGDRLWVRENWCDPEDDRSPVYRADLNESELASEAEVMRLTRAVRSSAFRPWRPSIHMPRWASRLTLVVTGTKIEPVQSISEADAISEGWQRQDSLSHDPEVHRDAAHDWYADLWASLHGLDSWNANPEVVALSFTVHKENIDAMPKPIEPERPSRMALSGAGQGGEANLTKGAGE